MGNMTWAIFSLVIGILFVCAEIFVPGGVLGVIGVIALITSIVFGYSHLGMVAGTYFLVLVVFLVLIFVMLSLKFFPKSPIGKMLTLRSSSQGFSAATENKYDDLLNCEGEACTDLRPCGMAVINNRKVDVTTEGGFVEKGEKVNVLKVEGSKVVVRKI